MITLSRASESAERVCRDTASLFLKFRKCGLIPILLGPIAVPLTLISTAALAAQNFDGIPEDWRDHVLWIVLGALSVLIFLSIGLMVWTGIRRRIERAAGQSKQAQHELQRQKVFFETLVENIPASVTKKDTDGKYMFVNKVICDAAGGAPIDFIGKSLEEAVGIGPNDELSDSSKEAIETGKPVIGIERKSVFLGNKTVCSNFVPIEGVNGKIDRLHTISFDITEIRHREDQLRQAQKMEAVGQLTGGIAHDFNNLLMVIIGNLELIASKSEGSALSAMAQNAIKASNRGADLTRRLLAFSRHQMLALMTVNLDDLMAGTTELLRRTLDETIEIEVTGGSNLWQCRADPGQLENAILNLALNARDAMPQGGKLTIGTSNENFNAAETSGSGEASAGEYAVLSISDTGTGMPSDVLDCVFEPFFTTKKPGSGTGLGLAMVHGFINQSGGHVAIDSEQGVGTTIRLYLPKSSDDPGQGIDKAGTVHQDDGNGFGEARPAILDLL